MWQFNPDSLVGYHVIDWNTNAQVRVEDSPQCNDMVEWCRNNCQGKFSWQYMCGHNRAEGESRNDCCTFGFENTIDAENFKNIFTHTWFKLL